MGRPRGMLGPQNRTPLTSVPEVPYPGGGEAPRAQALTVLRVAAARCAELRAELAAALPAEAAIAAREAAEELDTVAGALRRLGEGRPGRG